MVTSRQTPRWRVKLRLLMWELGNPDLKVKAWRRRRRVMKRLNEYEKREGIITDSPYNDR